MAITAADYEWINDYAELAEDYCVTLVRGATVQEFLRRLHAEPQGDVAGYAELEQWTKDVREGPLGSVHPIGATTVLGDQGEWVLGLEINGLLGTLPHLLAPLSTGTRLVSHFCTINAHDDRFQWDDQFHWYEDGTLRTFFEPLFPTERSGSTPDELVAPMREVGFSLREEEDLSDAPTTEAAFALAERLTGVHLTPDLLTDTTFTVGLVPQKTTKKR